MVHSVHPWRKVCILIRDLIFLYADSRTMIIYYICCVHIQIPLSFEMIYNYIYLSLNLSRSLYATEDTQQSKKCLKSFTSQSSPVVLKLVVNRLIVVICCIVLKKIFHSFSTSSIINNVIISWFSVVYYIYIFYNDIFGTQNLFQSCTHCTHTHPHTLLTSCGEDSYKFGFFTNCPTCQSRLAHNY